MLNLTVMCSNELNGCQWKSSLRELHTHEETCDYTLLGCTNNGCQDLVYRRDSLPHAQEYCLFRLIECKLCGELVACNQHQSHLDSTCPFVLVVCENGCKDSVKRKYVRLFCQYTAVYLIICIYLVSTTRRDRVQFSEITVQICFYRVSIQSNYTCVYLDKNYNSVFCIKALSCDMEEHETSCRDGHMKMMLKRIEATPPTSIETPPSDIDAMKEQIRRLTDTLSEKDMIMDQMRTRVDELTEARLGVPTAIKKVQSNLSVVEEDTRALHGRLLSVERWKESADRHRLTQDTRLAAIDMRVLSMECISYDGVLRWKLENFGRRFREAVNGTMPSLYSPPFCTSRSGYKMCARIYLNGDREGAGTHISLYFVIIPGVHDALLAWPFHQRITFTLIDQIHKKHISDSFLPDPASPSFARPAKNMNVASGCPCFVKHDVLRQSGYLVDDVLFLRISVDIKYLYNI